MKKVFAFALVLAMALCAVAYAEETAVTTYAEFTEAEVGTTVTIETYVQAKQGWWKDQATIYTQNEEGAYFLYNMPISQEDYDLLVPGTKIRVTGDKAEWAGEVELSFPAADELEEGEKVYEILEGEYVAEATDVTALLGTDELANEMNKKVSFKGLTVESYTYTDGDAATDTGAAFAYGWNGSGEEGTDADLYFQASIDGTTYTFTVEYYLCNETTEVYDAVRSLNVGDVIDLEGFLYWYNGANPHITAVTVK